MSKESPLNTLPPAREPASTDPEAAKDQYSLDEMMKALREKERAKDEEGEVVTRSDGSVARKVKRRRRRSDQPEKASPEKEKKNLLFKVTMVACLFFALFLVGFFIILSHNSKSHREGLEKTASEWTGAEVDLQAYKRLPFSLNAKALHLTWPESSYLRELSFSKIDGDANFTSFLGARLGGLQIGGATGKLVTGMPRVKGTVGHSFEEADFPFTFDQYYCQALDVIFGKSTQLGLRGVSASLRHIPNEGNQLTIDQGTMMLEGWKPFPISSGLMRFRDGVIDLKSLSLDPPESDDTLLTSSLKLSGLIPLKRGEKVRLKAETAQFSLSGLIGERLARFFSGAVIESHGEILYTMGEDELDEVVIRFSADQVRLSNLPFLGHLAELFPDRQLEELKFGSGLTGSAITGVLRVRPEGIAIENIEMAQKGNLRFRGGIVISKAGNIGGKVALSINRVFFASNELLVNSPLLRGTESTGYVKVDFRLGGTLAKPSDTFASELGIGRRLPGLNKPQSGAFEDLWDELGTPDLLESPGE